MFKTVALIALCLVGGSFAFEKSSLRLFQWKNSRSTTIQIEEPIDKLWRYNFNNVASSYCVTGFWLLHKVFDFNADYLNAPTLYVYGLPRTCRNIPDEIDNNITSVRFLDNPLGTSINIFQGNNFNGKIQTYNKSARKVEDSKAARSIIVTGCQDFTVFSEANFKGESVCIAANANCLPALIPNNAELGNFVNNIGSVKVGCNAKNTITSSVIIPEDADNFMGIADF